MTLPPYVYFRFPITTLTICFHPLCLYMSPSHTYNPPRSVPPFTTPYHRAVRRASLPRVRFVIYILLAYTTFTQPAGRWGNGKGEERR